MKISPSSEITGLSPPSLGVGGLHGGQDALRGDLVRLVVDGLALRTGPFRRQQKPLVRHLAKADLGQRRRQPHRLAEAVDLVQHRRRPVGQDQQRQRAEGDLLAVPVVVRFLQHGQAVVDGVCRRQPAALEAQPAQQCVGLDDALQRRSDHALLAGRFGEHAILKQRVVAQPGQREGGHRADAPGHVATALDAAVLRLEPSGQGVAHAGDEEAHRGARHHAGIDQHEVRVAWQNEVALERPLRRVDHRQGAARRVGGGERRDDGGVRVQRVGDRFGGVERLAAADADHDVGAHGAGEAGQPLDLLVGALATEFLDVHLDAPGGGLDQPAF